MTPAQIDEELRRVLEQRAGRVAARPPPPEVRGGEVVLLDVGPERLAVAVADVAHVLEPAPVTPIPGAAPHWAGILPGRAGFVAVLDVAAVLAVARDPVATGALVVVAGRGREVVLAVDRAVGLARLAHVDPPVGGLAGLAAELVAGVAPGPVTVLDCDRLLAALLPDPSPSRSAP